MKKTHLFSLIIILGIFLVTLLQFIPYFSHLSIDRLGTYSIYPMLTDAKSLAEGTFSLGTATFFHTPSFMSTLGTSLLYRIGFDLGTATIVMGFLSMATLRIGSYLIGYFISRRILFGLFFVGIISSNAQLMYNALFDPAYLIGTFLFGILLLSIAQTLSKKTSLFPLTLSLIILLVYPPYFLPSIGILIGYYSFQKRNARTIILGIASSIFIVFPLLLLFSSPFRDMLLPILRIGEQSFPMTGAHFGFSITSMIIGGYVIYKIIQKHSSQNREIQFVSGLFLASLVFLPFGIREWIPLYSLGIAFASWYFLRTPPLTNSLKKIIIFIALLGAIEGVLFFATNPFFEYDPLVPTPEYELVTSHYFTE